MRILMRVTAAGPQGVKLAGREYDVPDPEAKVLVDGGYAAAAPLPEKAPSAPASAAKGGKDYVPAPDESAAAKASGSQSTSKQQGGKEKSR